jgi:hypothetical protein
MLVVEVVVMQSSLVAVVTIVISLAAASAHSNYQDKRFGSVSAS